MKYYVYKFLSIIQSLAKIISWLIVIAIVYFLWTNFSKIESDSFFQKIWQGLNEDLPAGLLAGFIASVVIPFAAKYIQSWIRKLAIDVNVSFCNSKMEKAYKGYQEQIEEDIRNRLPSDISNDWTLKSQNAELKEIDALLPIEAIETSVDPELQKLSKKKHIYNCFTYLFSEYLLRPSQKKSPLFLQGPPGSGKSTLVFEIMRIVTSHLEHWRGGWIPIILFAHDFKWETLSNAKSFKDFLCTHLKEYGQPNEDYEQFVKEIYRSYGSSQFLFIIDGLDEISNSAKYGEYSLKLNSLIEQDLERNVDIKNRFILTCRTDDNFNHISGHLFTLKEWNYKKIEKHLRRQKRLTKEKSNRQQIQNIIDNLERSKHKKLLQNYIRNPFLYSVISSYYRKEEVNPDTQLRDIFETVLSKELSREISKEIDSPLQRKTLKPVSVNYVKSLVAPFCFSQMVSKLNSQNQEELTEDEEFEIFRNFLGRSTGVGQLLFSHDGFVNLFFNEKNEEDGCVKADMNQNLDSKLLELGQSEVMGKDQADDLNRKLNELSAKYNTLTEYRDAVFRFLFKDLKEILHVYRLAIVADEGKGRIRRFRHNRMREFFISQYIDREGIKVFKEWNIDLKNIWLREPLQMHAAISEDPRLLLKEFSSLIGEYGSSTDIKIREDLLKTVSGIISFLPANLESSLKKEVKKAVRKFALQTRSLLKLQKEVGDADLYAQMVVSVLSILKNIYNSEFYLGTLSVKNDESFDPFRINGREKRSWRKIFFEVLKLPSAYQEYSYQDLYSISRKYKDSGLSPRNMLYLILDSALVFNSDFKTQILDFRQTWNEKIIPWKGYIAEKILAGSFWIMTAFYIVSVVRAAHHFGGEYIPPAVFVILGIAIVGVICCFTFLLKVKGLFEWFHLWHLPTLLLFGATKRVHKVIQFTGTSFALRISFLKIWFVRLIKSYSRSRAFIDEGDEPSDAPLDQSETPVNLGLAELQIHDPRNTVGERQSEEIDISVEDSADESTTIPEEPQPDDSSQEPKPILTTIWEGTCKLAENTWDSLCDFASNTWEVICFLGSALLALVIGLLKVVGVLLLVVLGIGVIWLLVMAFGYGRDLWEQDRAENTLIECIQVLEDDKEQVDSVQNDFASLKRDVMEKAAFQESMERYSDIKDELSDIRESFDQKERSISNSHNVFVNEKEETFQKEYLECNEIIEDQRHRIEELSDDLSLIHKNILTYNSLAELKKECIYWKQQTSNPSAFEYKLEHQLDLEELEESIEQIEEHSDRVSTFLSEFEELKNSSEVGSEDGLSSSLRSQISTSIERCSYIANRLKTGLERMSIHQTKIEERRENILEQKRIRAQKNRDEADKAGAKEQKEQRVENRYAKLMQGDSQDRFQMLQMDVNEQGKLIVTVKKRTIDVENFRQKDAWFVWWFSDWKQNKNIYDNAIEFEAEFKSHSTFLSNYLKDLKSLHRSFSDTFSGRQSQADLILKKIDAVKKTSNAMTSLVTNIKLVSQSNTLQLLEQQWKQIAKEGKILIIFCVSVIFLVCVVIVLLIMRNRMGEKVGIEKVHAIHTDKNIEDSKKLKKLIEFLTQNPFGYKSNELACRYVQLHNHQSMQIVDQLMTIAMKRLRKIGFVNKAIGKEIKKTAEVIRSQVQHFNRHKQE